ncbi:CMGC/DYRK/DYRK2 protein kinase [Lyophyllum atratum]|nr:CMGC/DYRK/DYRK2 protein kinase [Lyophyllum atratum]
MSAPPSPHISHGNTPHKKKDRPPALDIPDDERKASSDGELRYEQGMDNGHLNRKAQQILQVPPLPTGPLNLSSTPDQRQIYEPVTPARDPAAIDRRGLVGVGELATPRWTRAESQEEEPPRPDTATEVDEYEVVVPEDVQGDEPDSPWTIEAVDGETSEREDPMDVKPPPRPLRSKPSIADESGGEEILYPRKFTAPVPDLPARPQVDTAAQESQPPASESNASEADPPSSPPSAFVSSVRKAKKRTSGEFEMDQFGTLVSKQRAVNAHPGKAKDEKASVRKHRSLNVNTISSPRDAKGKERRRESVGLTINSSIKSPPAKMPERHVRQTSASSSSNADSHPPRRAHTTDFSHLPPSPSSSSIQQFLRHPTTSGSSHTPPLHKENTHNSPNVAHSLLRGTQEGWSGLDDEATAEALRKLDGLSGKTARTRASVGSFVRSSSSSRPGTPAGKSGGQWEGVGASDSGKPKRSSGNIRDSVSAVKEREPRQSIGLGLAITDALGGNSDLIGTAISSDELSGATPGTEKTPKKAGTASTRSSFTPKRGSTSSTTYTSTPSSRDSASMSTNTSMTSVSGTSGRHSTGKARRNSAGSDISSIHSSDATSLKDRVAALAINSDASEDVTVPPVPPLPKDLSSYRSPLPTSVSFTFPQLQGPEEREKTAGQDLIQERATSLEVPSFTSPPPTAPSPLAQGHRLSQHYTSGYTSVNSAPESAPAVPKTPSKKWSFSSALNLNFSSSPSSSSQKSGFPLSPRAGAFGQQIRKATSKDQGVSSKASSKDWETKQPDAMVSAGSLASLSSVGSVRTPALPSASSKTPDRSHALSRTGTGSSGDTNHTTSGLSVPQSGPLSPTASVRRGQSKRLTPSSIPFFRRSSSQSMQLPPSNSSSDLVISHLSSGNLSSAQGRQKVTPPPRDQHNPPSTSVPGSTHKKSSVLSLALGEAFILMQKKLAKELQRMKDAEKEKGKQEKLEKERQKKEDKDRSESRISVLMGGVTRKRGKTLSSTDPRKPKSPVNLPPMHMSALEPATAQRVARLKPSNSTSTPVAQPTLSRTASSTSRLTSQTVSSMQKQSDSSLRSRNQLPTIAGSPSVGTNWTNSSQTLKEFKEPPSSMMNSVSGHPKETPTKIPRISSRTSAAASPPLKGSGSALSIRRASATVNVAEPASSSTNPSPSGAINEFGVMDYGEETPAKTAKHSSIRASPSMSTSRVPRQSIASNSIRKGSRDSVSFTARKASTSSITSMSTPAASTETSTHHHRFSALSPSKLKLLAPKISLPTARSSNAAGQGIHQAMNSPSSSRQSLSTPSPAPSTVDEEELLGDEEMLHYIRRQQAKKMAAGATQEELDELLQFPEPLPPGTPTSPSSTLRNSSQYLSDYERKEILDYPSVYCLGAKSKKKPATLDISTNNYGYDDERGDYLVVNKDHLAYRYEIIDTLGKGSFGQVLQCRDHCTGESVAVKIIRNKKRFHHQALVEIKILDNLRKWDADGKHHVLKMIEHFYFRNHLCIATELLSINLYELIKANGFVGFTTALIRRFTSQMLMSLSLMRHHRIVHCDLKPENVLLRHPSKSAIKVIDFGSSCFENEKIYTYIQSRFYRSPEVILGMNYHMAIDMWSLGCILAELYTGFPIFPGENEQEQLSCIMEVLGVPEKEYINRSTRKKLFFDLNGAPRAVINSKGRRRKPGTKTLQQVLRCTDEDFLDFISKCLVWDPERRIKPQAAMRHPFVASGRRPKVPSSTTKSTSVFVQLE